MDMEVIIPSPAAEFNFDSACTTPYVSAPSSPQRFGSNVCFSAPTSPTRVSAFYFEFNNFHGGETTGNPESAIPFTWEEKPGTPKTKEARNEDDDGEFAFDFSGQLERTSLSADELFDGGKIKPLKPPPRVHYPETVVGDSPKSPKSPKRMWREALSPRNKRKDFDPFSAAFEQTRRAQNQEQTTTDQRGRERTHNPSNSNARHKSARSLSPLRVSDLLFEPEINTPNAKNPSSSSSSSSPFSNNWYRKWKLKDLLLFRSASEGSKDTIKKYAMLKKNSGGDDVKNSSFRSTESVGSVSSRRRGPVSAHEMHYTVNRAAAEEMRRKTFLPYKQGLLGCLGFGPAVHEISKGLNPFSRP